MRKSLVLVSALLAALAVAGCGHSETRAESRRAKESKEWRAMEREDKEAFGTGTTSTAPESPPAKTTQTTTSQPSAWSSAEGARARDGYWQHYMAAMPAGESTAHWKAIGECSLKKLESQFTPADFADGDSHILATEVQDGVRCGIEGG